MGQVTLAGAPISKVEIEVAEAESKVSNEPRPVAVNIESDCGWSMPYVKAATEHKKDLGYAAEQIQLFTTSNMDGICYSLNKSCSHEQPHGFLGGMYGSGGHIGLDGDSIKELFKGFMESKLEAQKAYYKNFKDSKDSWSDGSEHEYYFYRLIPLKNYVVVLSPYKKLVQMFSDLGFDFEAWNKEYMAIEENPTTDEYTADIQKYRELHTQGKMLEKQAQVIKESIRHKLGETETYGKATKDLWPEDGLDKLYAMLGDKVVEMKRLNVILKEIADKGRGGSDDILGVSWVAKIL